MEITNSCPDCGYDLAADDTCPNCGWSPHAKPVLTEESDHLDQARLERIIADRKSIYRMRTVMLVLSLALFGAALQCVWQLWHGRHELNRLSICSYLGFLILSLLGGCVFFARSRQYAQDYAKAMQHHDPASAPDFSELGDGSRVTRNLEKLK